VLVCIAFENPFLSSEKRANKKVLVVFDELDITDIGWCIYVLYSR